LKLYYDSAKTKELEEKIVIHWLESQLPRGKEVHVSDLVNCLLKYYCRAKGIEPNFTKKVIGLFVFGVVSHKVLQELFPEDEREFKPYYKNCFQKMSENLNQTNSSET